MTVSFLNGIPALMVDKERVIVASDFHIGIEFRFDENGLHFPNASKRMGEELRKAYEKGNAKGIILLGDVKERILNTTIEENIAIREFFDQLSGIDVRIARGNHDAYLDKILNKLGIKAPIQSEILLKDVALLHGNTMPSDEAMEKKTIVTGHGHMVANINGADQKVWVVADHGKELYEKYENADGTINMVVAPAFNGMIAGTRLSAKSDSNLPLFKNNVFDLASAKIYNLDGEPVGSVGQIEKD